MQRGRTSSLDTNLFFDDPRDAALLVHQMAANPSNTMIAGYMSWMLTQATPDDWHAVATTWNWDGGTAPLLWIIRQPDCDRATALYVFWASSPAYYLQNVGHRAPNPMASEIRRRWRDGYFRRAELAYDLVPWFRVADFAALDAQHGEVARNHLPVSMRISVPGRSVDTRDYWMDGIPTRFWPEELRRPPRPIGP